MSMIGKYARLDAAQHARLSDDPGWVWRLIRDLDEAGSPLVLDIDKSWDALRFLFARAGITVDIFNGESFPTNDIWGHGSPGCVAPERVAEVARRCADTPFESLIKGISPADLAKATVYPMNVWQVWNDEQTHSYLGRQYSRLVPYFQDAARDGHTVVTWLG